jgi:exodeoxyribonuclease VII small subunit
LTDPRSGGNLPSMTAQPSADRPTFEQLMKRLEGVVEKLESNDLSLEEAIDAYQSGILLAKEGHERLAEAERRIEEVTRGGEKRQIDVQKVLEERE